MPEDLLELRDAHQALFPIDYESHFYDCVIHNKDQIFSWAAVCRSADTVEFESAESFSLPSFRLFHAGMQRCNRSG